jgi:hypothetical protein
MCVCVCTGESSTVEKKTFELHTGVKAVVLSLVYWENSIQSALVLSAGSLFYIITHVYDYSVISLSCWILLVLISLSVTSSLATRGLHMLGYPGHPLLTKLHTPVSTDLIEESALVARAKELAVLINLLYKQWNVILGGSDSKLTAKAAGALFLTAFIMQRLSVMTLVFLVFFGGMTAPRFYQEHQYQIDQLVEKVQTEVKARTAEHVEKLMAKVNPAVDAAFGKVEEAKVKLLVVLQQVVAKVPAPYADKLKAFLPVSSPSTTTEKVEKTD